MPPTITQEVGAAFAEWLYAEMRSRNMSQRMLAELSGVDHATICRLLNPGSRRVPSLTTAFALQQALANDGSSGQESPATRIERALRRDAALTDAEVREIMDVYWQKKRDGTVARDVREVDKAREVRRSRRDRGVDLLPTALVQRHP